MAAGKSKYYVVWIGQTPGVYDSWELCSLMVDGWKGAVYKGFDSLEEARKAFELPPENFIEKKTAKGRKKEQKTRELPQQVCRQALAVDAACSGNPGQMEYRAVYLGDMEEKFHFGPVLGTNNIGEFLAIVHALALYKSRGLDWPVYSDSRNAIAWVRQKQCKTTLERNELTLEVFQRIDSAERWLRENTYSNPILKWETSSWGEIPADFGRK
ncbi:MAG: ribonuclease H family protein [Bacteroidaceae bacterium]|nr:ribonuclease H family protein [Bacteroidaceae bacterium]